MLFDVIRTLLRGGHVNMLLVLAQVLSTFFIIFFILPLHEYAHGWTANKLGDPTARLEGRLTFNPLASVDIMGALGLLLFGFGWAKPVPVDSRYFKNPRRDMAITALAGPVSNLLAAFLGAVLFYVVSLFLPLQNGFVQFLRYFLNYYAMVNVCLAVFNLIPMPPLDGSKILMAFLSRRALAFYYQYQNILSLITFVLLFSGAASGPLSAAQSFFGNVIFRVAELPFRLFGAI